MKQVRNHSRSGRRTALLSVAAGMALLTVACGSSPSFGGSSPAADGGSSSASPGLVAFARCMRAHGVTDYPDSGAPASVAPGSDLNPSNPAYQSARQACEYLHPHANQSQAASSQNLAAALSFAKCMRQHGITNYPDPGPHSGPNGGEGVNLSGIDINSPQFKAAQQACQQYQVPNGKG
jgi:hypothetical protein